MKVRRRLFNSVHQPELCHESDACLRKILLYHFECLANGRANFFFVNVKLLDGKFINRRLIKPLQWFEMKTVTMTIEITQFTQLKSTITSLKCKRKFNGFFFGDGHGMRRKKKERERKSNEKSAIFFRSNGIEYFDLVLSSTRHWSWIVIHVIRAQMLWLCEAPMNLPFAHTDRSMKGERRKTSSTYENHTIKIHTK